MTPNAVVTPHRLSAEAGREVLVKGGNAVDAAIAAVTAQGVVAPETCGVGGDLFALVHQPGWEVPLALNSSGRAGSNASSAAIRDEGHRSIPLDHEAVVTVPGCVDGLIALSDRLGRLDLGELLTPAISLALDGFESSTEQSQAFTRQESTYATNPAVRDFYPAGDPIEAGMAVKRPDLARTLSDIASSGREAFYGGTAGEDIQRAVGGLITAEDLSRNQAEWINPISIDVYDLTAWTIPPNSQGYLGPATLAVFEMLDPPEDPDDPMWWHLLIEAYRCLAWERDDIVSEPENAPLPADMILDRERLERAAESVNREHTGVWPSNLTKSSGTAYLTVVDSDRMAVSIIQSNYRGTGSPFGAARSGFLLHDRGAGFNLTSGHPNELAPGKRPLHTLSPTLWTNNSGPMWTLGCRGGAVQPQLVAQLGARAIGAGRDLDDAQADPRWTLDEFGPGSDSSLSVEPGITQTVLEVLTAKGHQFSVADGPQGGWGPMSIIDVAKGRAAADPRVDTTAALVF